METIFVALLGAVQGATEFLPVSSSGHLAAGQLVLGERLGAYLDQSLTLEILLHLATLLAVIVFYRKDILGCAQGVGRSFVAVFHGNLTEQLRNDLGARLALAVVIGSIPTAVLGLGLEESSKSVGETPFTLGLSFMGTACFLLASRWWKGGSRDLTLPIALIIGVVQGLAVLPGISRSGATIVAALALGMDREDAARFSFLLSVPAIAGAALLKIDIDQILAEGRFETYLLGALSAFVIGVVALIFLVRLVRGGRLWLFAPYVAAVGMATMFL